MSWKAKPVGLHINGGSGNARARLYVERARPAIMKWLDGTGDEGSVKHARAHGALTILRIYEEDQSAARWNGYLSALERAIRTMPWFDAYEMTYNEAYQTPDTLGQRALWDIEGMQLAERHGKRAIVGCFSTGMPDVGAWHHYEAAIRYAGQHGHIIGLHEYGGGPEGMSYGGGWLCLRYRRALQAWREMGVAAVPKIAITEGGIDVVDQLPPQHRTRGYQTARNMHPGSVGDYATQWARICWEHGKDPEMIGAVDFGFAADDPQWWGFDLSRDEDMLRRLEQEMAQLRTQAAPAPPVSPPAPQPPQQRPTEIRVVPCVQVLRGEGWLAAGRRALGRGLTPAELTAFRAANPTVINLTVGQWLVSPWHRAVLKER